MLKNKLTLKARFHYERGKEHSLFVLLIFFALASILTARFNRRSVNTHTIMFSKKKTVNNIINIHTNNSQNCQKDKVKYLGVVFFFSFQPFPSVRGGHSVSSFSTSFCLQHPFPSLQLPAYLPLLHLKIFSLVSLFSSFPVTPFPSFFFLHTLGLSS